MARTSARAKRSAGAYGAANTAVNSVLPAITGATTLGAVMTCSTGTWSLAPTITYQWRRNLVAISGETASHGRLTGIPLEPAAQEGLCA